MLSKKNLNPKKYEFLTLKDDLMATPSLGGDGINDLLNNQAEGDDDERIIDNDTFVKNLKTSRLELREKLFVDKSIRKQLGVTMEEKANVNQNVNIMNRQNTKGYFSNDMIAMARNMVQTYQDRGRIDSDQE